MSAAGIAPARHQLSGGPRTVSEGLPRIGFVGAGRVGTTLGAAFARAGWPVTAIASRDQGRRDRFRSHVPDARAYAEPAGILDDADLIFLTVPDDAIAPVAASLRLYSGQMLVHTSGLLDAGVLRPAMAAGTGSGSFHPLVAFADVEGRGGDLSGATVALDGDEPVVSVLAELAQAIGAQPVRLPEGAKPAYHAAAVLAAGGFIGLLDAVAELGRVAGLDERGSLAIFGPLVRGALANAERLGIRDALTGPIVRGDAGTVQVHLATMAASAPAALELYVAAARREIDLALARGELSPDGAAGLRNLLDRAAKG